MEHQKFKLFASCIPVKGAQRSIICDLQRGKIKFIPNELYEILIKFDGRSISDVLKHYEIAFKSIILDYFNLLVSHEFIFFTDNPELFPKLNLSWNQPEQISNGIIDVGLNSNHNWKRIFNEYEQVKCKHLQIRFYSTVQIFELLTILKLAENSVLNSIQLILPFTDETTEVNLNRIIKTNNRVTQIIVHSTPVKKAPCSSDSRQIQKVFFTHQRISSSDQCGNINLDYFSVNQATFLESVNKNSCLNGKISIDENGRIRNCPSLNISFGSIETTSFSDVITNDLFTQTWNITKDQINICKDCEFRYICTDCRAFLNETQTVSLSKPKKCNYNPYTTEWE